VAAFYDVLPNTDGELDLSETEHDALNDESDSYDNNSEKEEQEEID
jgi:hypothetical protein